MWEAIRANKRRSVALIAGMGTLLMLLGLVVGEAVAPGGALPGLGIGGLLWVILWFSASTGGSQMLLGSAGAREVEHDDAPMLFNLVEEMTIAAGLPKVPRVFIIDNNAPNAFAVGTEGNSAVAVTTGLLSRLNRDELQGVVAHEIGHIKNADTLFLTRAGIMVGAIVIISEVFIRAMWVTGGGRRRSDSRGGGQARALMLLAGVLFAILAPIVAQLLYFACSRRREYLADACSARFTRYPAGLASALDKISNHVGSLRVNKAVAPMFTVNPRAAAGGGGWWGTHPPTDDRIEILRSMAGGAGYAAYEQAFKQSHRGTGLLGLRTLQDADEAPLREPSADTRGPRERTREAVDMLHRTAGMLMYQCACGLKIKIPPGYKKDEVKCPSCSRTSPIPHAAALGALAAAGVASEQADRAAGKKPDAEPEGGAGVLEHTSGQWTSARCECGGTVQLSPTFSARMASCKTCGRHYEVKHAE